MLKGPCEKAELRKNKLTNRSKFKRKIRYRADRYAASIELYKVDNIHTVLHIIIVS